MSVCVVKRYAVGSYEECILLPQLDDGQERSVGQFDANQMGRSLGGSKIRPGRFGE